MLKATWKRVSFYISKSRVPRSKISGTINFFESSWIYFFSSERKARAAAQAAKKKLEMEVQDLSSNAESSIRAKDDLLKQFQRLQRAYREAKAEADDLRGEKDSAVAAQR